MLLWTDEANDEAIDLGDPFRVYQVFAELARQDDDAKWAELFSVPEFAEQEVEPEWLESVRQQAHDFLHDHGEDLSDEAQEMLQILAGLEDE